jgi:excisionase family DNA binding protein
MQQGYLPISEAAQYASVSARTIKRWIKAGLPVYQGTFRGKVLIKPSDIDTYLEKKTAPKVDLEAMVEDVLQGLGTISALAPVAHEPTSLRRQPSSRRAQAKWSRT